jgi:hypothetical protein
MEHDLTWTPWKCPATWWGRTAPGRAAEPWPLRSRRRSHEMAGRSVRTLYLARHGAAGRPGEPAGARTRPMPPTRTAPVRRSARCHLALAPASRRGQLRAHLHVIPAGTARRGRRAGRPRPLRPHPPKSSPLPGQAFSTATPTRRLAPGSKPLAPSSAASPIRQVLAADQPTSYSSPTPTPWLGSSGKHSVRHRRHGRSPTPASASVEPGAHRCGLRRARVTGGPAGQRPRLPRPAW